jgi:hypothetical protein
MCPDLFQTAAGDFPWCILVIAPLLLFGDFALTGLNDNHKALLRV